MVLIRVVRLVSSAGRRVDRRSLIFVPRRCVAVSGSRPVPCYHPLTAYLDGRRRVSFKLGCDVYREIRLPCGQCIGCRLERSRQWATRCMHENQMHEFSCFITLTYAPDFLPVDNSLHYSDFQAFMRRLRKRLARCERQRIRFFMCGEYGALGWRPHFHALLFGYAFPDREVYKKLPSGSMLYTSKVLEELWPYGFSSVGDVTFESAAYIARYVCKKITDKDDKRPHQYFDLETGEVFVRTPEFGHMSLKPGIGATWFDKFRGDVFPRDSVVVRGAEARPPKYYTTLLERVSPEAVDWIKVERDVKAMSREMDNSPDRLRAQETVARARLTFKKRTLDNE